MKNEKINCQKVDDAFQTKTKKKEIQSFSSQKKDKGDKDINNDSDMYLELNNQPCHIILLGHDFFPPLFQLNIDMLAAW